MNSQPITQRLLEAMGDSRYSSPVDLARAIGISRQAVHDWVKGNTVFIRNEHLFKMADVLDVEARWLATGEGPKRKQNYVLDENTMSVIRQIESLPCATRESVLHLIRTMQVEWMNSAPRSKKRSTQEVTCA